MILRLQKYLSQSGVCSRRHAEEAIRRGEIKVNGVVATIGQSVDPERDHIEFDGQFVDDRQKLVYYALNKPRGIESTCAQKGGQSIVDIVDISQRVFPIGRLDKDSSGLILLTNDGRLTHRLLHPSFEHEKEYLVTTYGKIDDGALEQMRRGVRYINNKEEIIKNKWEGKEKGKEKGKGKQRNSFNGRLKIEVGSFISTQPCEIFRAGSDTFRIILKEGKNRQIRRMVEAVGYEVKRLKRIRIEHIELRDLPEGAYRELKRGEREELLRRAGVPLVSYPPITGVVIHGDGKGKSLGFPTANIALAPGILPEKTFSCRVKIGEETYLGAGVYRNIKYQISNIKEETGEGKEKGKGKQRNLELSQSADEGGWGMVSPNDKRLTINDKLIPLNDKPETFGIFEVHILDFDRDVYTLSIVVDILDEIRDNQAFTSPEKCVEQLTKDVQHVRVHWGRAI